MISTKYLTHKVYTESYGQVFPKFFFPPFCGHLEFLRKTQKHVYLGNGASDFDKIFDSEGICSLLATFPKIVFPLFLAAILNFCIKCKNMFISETGRDAKFTGDFSQKSLSRHFWRPS